MPFSRMDRKVALVQLGVSNADIARAVGAHESLVSHVLAGRLLNGKKGRRIIAYVAKLIGAPEAEVFPGSQKPETEEQSA